MERRAVALAAFGPDAAALQLDAFLADGESEAGAVCLLRERIVEALERLEQSRQIGARDPDAGIRDRDVNRVSLAADLDQDLTGGRELDRIRHEIEQHLLD